MVKKIRYEKGTGIPAGIQIEPNSYVQFSVVMPGADEVILHIFDKGHKKPKYSVVMNRQYKTGSVFSMRVFLEAGRQYEYCYQEKENFFVDSYAPLVTGRKKWGDFGHRKEMRGSFRLLTDVDSRENMEDARKPIPMDELMIYRLHVRGFTKHRSSGVSARGTFQGLKEKILYLKELGVNAVELMPCYEFEECIPEKTDHRFEEKYRYEERRKRDGLTEKRKNRINYWGYTSDAFYFAPKASYAAEPDEADVEFRSMVSAFHANGMEVYMDMYFKEGELPWLMVQCLRYWNQKYAIDGFHLSNNEGNIEGVVRDPLLSGVKLFRSNWTVSKEEALAEGKHLGEYHDGFLYDIRRFLKGDDGQIANCIFRMKNNPYTRGVVNYLANSNGFTLMDAFSYDWKHNEANGEDGQDGSSYNASWNCGVEGRTRKRQVLSLRRKQIRNAFLLLMTSQGIPLILAGDEFGNSQRGNNNAYCQDNEISWIDWRLREKEAGIFDFVKKLIAFRRENHLLHMKEEYKGMDFLNCGCPDFSVHGIHAWYADKRDFSRVVAFMYCGRYDNESRDIYLAFNMHWEPHDFDIPMNLWNAGWKKVFDTSKEAEEVKTEEIIGRSISLEARSAVLLVAEPIKKEKKKRKKQLEILHTSSVEKVPAKQTKNQVENFST